MWEMWENLQASQSFGFMKGLTGQKYYECKKQNKQTKNHCGKSFPISNSLGKDEKIPTGEKLYKCKCYHKVFRSLSNIGVPEMTDIGEKAH